MTLTRKEFGEETGVSELVFESADGVKRRVTLRIGKPYFVADSEWACPVDLSGFERRHADIRGGDSMQALCLAISLLWSRVEDFRAKGGRILDTEDGSEWGPRELGAHFGRLET